MSAGMDGIGFVVRCCSRVTRRWGVKAERGTVVQGERGRNERNYLRAVFDVVLGRDGRDGLDYTKGRIQKKSKRREEGATHLRVETGKRDDHITGGFKRQLVAIDVGRSGRAPKKKD
jgi:hypothetical protein